MKILKIKSLNINSLKGEFEVDFEKFLKDCWDAKNLASARIHTWPPDA